MTERLPPQDRSAEKSVLGSILRDNRNLDTLIEMLRREDFYFDAHQKVWQAAIGLYEKSKPVDLLTLADVLKKAKQLDDVGGEPFLGDLWDGSPTGCNAEYHAAIVREKSVARALIHAGTEIVAKAYDQCGPAAETLEDAERSILAIADGYREDDNETLQQLLTGAQNRIDARKNHSMTAGMPTGFVDLDVITCGLQASEFSIIGARPGIGKTSLATQIARNVAMAGEGVLLLSLEQSRTELAERLLCMEAKVDSYNIKTGRVSTSEIEQLVEAGDRLRPLPLFIDDSTFMTPLRIAGKVRRFKSRKSVSLVILDYLQLIEPENRRVQRVEQIDVICARLKAIARETKVHLCCCCQLNRASEGHEEPELRDLRESGGIEANADKVLLLWKEREDGNEIGVKVAKNRNGRTGRLTLAWLKQFTRFENAAIEFGQHKPTIPA